MAPSLKSASVVFLLTIPSLVIAASPACTLKDSAPAASTCGTYGDVTNFDYFIEDLYDPQYTSILSCASECGNRTNCKSFNLRTEERAFCELHSGTQQNAGFVSENDANRTTSSYQGFDLDCFDCVYDASNQRLAVNESSSSTSASFGSQSQTSSQLAASIGFSTQGTASPTLSSSASRSVSSSTSGFNSSSSTSDPQPSTLMFIVQGQISSASVTNSSTTSAPRTTLESLFSSSTSSFVPLPSSATYSAANSSSTGNSTVGTSQWTTATAFASSDSASGSQVPINRNSNSNVTLTSNGAPYVNSTMANNSSSALTANASSPAPTVSSSDPKTTTYRELAVPRPRNESVTEYLISTVYTTSVQTFRECPLPAKGCRIGLVTTSRLPITTTFVPITKVVVPRPTIISIPPGYAMAPLYKFPADTLNVTRTIEAGSAVCPRPTTDAQFDFFSRENRERVCYQAGPPDPAPVLHAIAVPIKEAKPELTAVALSVEEQSTPPAMNSTSLANTTSFDKSSIKIMSYHINRLASPPCSLGLDGFDGDEEAYRAHCPDRTSSSSSPSTTTSSPPTSTTPSANPITTPSSSSSSTTTPTISTIILTITTITAPTTLLTTPTTSHNQAFDHPEEALWTWTGETGSPWSLPPPGTEIPTGLKLATTGPEWWTEEAFRSRPTGL